MPTQYDPRVLQQYADDLYSQAKWIIFGTALRYFFGALLLSLACAAALSVTPAGRGPAGLIITIIFCIIGIASGIDAGRTKAFELKLKAQQILCQVQIEQNSHQQEKALGTGN